MVPSIFVRLHTLPLSANGKLDLTTLPPPTGAELLNGIAPKVPVSATEKALLALVRELLADDSIAADDSFFLAGGHSLLGMQLLLRLRDRFGVDLNLRQLFEAPTARRLAVVVETMLNHPIDSRPNSKSIFWVQSRVVGLAKAFGDDRPLLSVALTAEDFRFLGEQPAIPDIAACLVRKIQATAPKGPYRIGGFCLGGILAYEVASQLRSAGHGVPLLVLVNTPNPTNWNSEDSLTRNLRYLGYLIKRATHLGLRRTVEYSSDHLPKRFSHMKDTDRRYVRQVTEVAVRAYRPPRYHGKVLLLLASERPPHVKRISP